jgi:ribosomal protein RSM22 (predicted rRNA methylase)
MVLATKMLEKYLELDKASKNNTHQYVRLSMIKYIHTYHGNRIWFIVKNA